MKTTLIYQFECSNDKCLTDNAPTSWDCTINIDDHPTSELLIETIADAFICPVCQANGNMLNIGLYVDDKLIDLRTGYCFKED